ncbi:hypothetical protein CASFOL_000523 [Castilleja foliolosa]|uniref:ATP-dependent DNA helicase n=1 Tax=Castilleja foliolosa TaxID=1961234 RepID=A0ABD3EPF8_9LAMI
MYGVTPDSIYPMISYTDNVNPFKIQLRLSDSEIHNYTLVDIEKLLKQQSKSLRDYESMPFPEHDGSVVGHSRLISDELNYDRKALSLEHGRLFSNMTTEQKGVYSNIISAVNSDKGGVFFVYGYGGTGKTYLWRTLSAALRSKGHIVLNVASSGIASLLLPGGRTAHSRFGIPLNPHEGSDCNIRKGTPLADLMIRCKLIIWDEAPMIRVGSVRYTGDFRRYRYRTDFQRYRKFLTDTVPK